VSDSIISRFVRPALLLVAGMLLGQSRNSPPGVPRPIPRGPGASRRSRSAVGDAISPGSMAGVLVHENAPVATPPSDLLAQLRELGELRTAGILTDDEFETQERRIFGS